MSDPWREFGTSRKTVYRIFKHDKDHSILAPTDRSRRPVARQDRYSGSAAT